MKHTSHFPRLHRSATRLLLGLVLALFAVSSQAQIRNRTISGIVTDELGEPLPGAHVSIVKVDPTDALQAVSTDVNGHFQLTFPSNVKQITVSFVGFSMKTVTLTAESSYEIRLKANTEIIEEIVVTGYQTISRERATGSFAKVSDEELKQVRLNSLDNLLEGRVAGYTNGKIRGTTSMNGMTTPLYIIDGFPIENTRYKDSGWNIEEDLPQLNMEDIESITVLKDAAAASIYGARAANGVIVITTKKAANGETNISFSSTLTFSPYSYHKDNIADAATIIGIEKEWAQSNPNLQVPDAATYAQSLLSNAVYTNAGIRTLLQGYTGQLSQSEVNAQLERLSAQGYRYYNEMEKYAKRNPFYQQYNLSVAKTTDKNMFSASATYRNNRLEDKYSENESIGLNIQNSTKLTKWLTLDLGSYLNYGTGTTQTFSVLSPGYSFLPYNRLMNDDGTFYTNTVAERESESFQAILNDYGMYNMDITPLDEISMNHKKNKDLSSRFYAKLGIEFTPWLKYNAMFQYEYGSYRVEQLKDKKSYSVRSKVNGYATDSGNGDAVYNLPYGHQLYTEDQYTNAYNFRQQLDFQKNFNEKHDVTVILGSETRHSKVEFTSNNLYNYDPDLLSYTAVDGNSMSNVYGMLGSFYWNNAYDLTKKNEIVNRFVSFYGNAGYTYDNRYTVTGSLRWDRSNLWGTNSKYQNKPLWSAGSSWNLHNETFFKVPAWVDMLKLRFSYGIGGNIAKDSAPYMTVYYNPNYNVGGMEGSISRRPNPELSWEKTATTNIGIDFGFFNGRMNGSIDYYNKLGTDLLANTMGVPTEGFGYSTYTINNGEMFNRGVEISLSGDIIRTKDFNWNASLLYSYNKNEVTYVNVEAPVAFIMRDYPESYPRIGNPYNAIYAYKWAGLNEEGIPQVYDESGEKTINDPATLESLEYAGSTLPTHSGSFGSTLSYKNFDLSFLFVFEAGHKMRNTFLPYFSSGYSSAGGGYILNLATPVNSSIVNRWQQPGDELHTDIPRIVFGETDMYLYDSGTIYQYADINVLDASNIRLNNVSLTYRLPQSWCSKVCLKNARIQFNVENVCTFAKSRDAKYLLGGYNAPNYVVGLYLNF